MPMSVANPTAAEADRAAVVEEPEGMSIPAVIRPGSTAPLARGRRSLLLTELLREARLIAKATDETEHKLTLSESAQRARTAKARKNARLNEASPVVAKHAKQKPLNMLTLGDSAISMMVKGLGTILTQLPKRQVSPTSALVTELCRESPNHDVPEAFLQRRSHDQ